MCWTIQDECHKVLKPATIHEYNRHKTHVDKPHDITNTYFFNRETLKQTKKLFTHILDLILWTVLPNSPPVFQYYHTKISYLYWSGSWYEKVERLPEPHMTTCRYSQLTRFDGQHSKQGQWKEKSETRTKLRCSERNVRLCVSPCVMLWYAKLIS
jgi:hypothetical protein